MANKTSVAGLAARSRISLAIIAGEQGDLRTHNEIFADLRERGRAAGDRNLMFVALMDALWAETEAGNVGESNSLVDRLADFDASLFRRAEDTLLPAYALRSAWEGDFGTAYAHVKDTAERLTTAPRRAMRFGEIALYAAAAGLLQESNAAAVKSEALVRDVAGTRARSLSRTTFARVFLALAYAMLREFAAGVSVLESVTFSSGVQRSNFSPLVEAARAFIRFRQGAASVLTPVQARLRESLLGGYALLIEQLMRKSDEDDALFAVTPLSSAERVVLQHIERGLSSKEIASLMARSPQTIDTQVKSILRKLNCRGRSEAAYFARRRGLLD
jgi:DNA-binding CsgD family transcriptional regulator